jgi:hypothetical protein
MKGVWAENEEPKSVLAEWNSLFSIENQLQSIFIGLSRRDRKQREKVSLCEDEKGKSDNPGSIALFRKATCERISL